MLGDVGIVSPPNDNDNLNFNNLNAELNPTQNSNGHGGQTNFQNQNGQNNQQVAVVWPNSSPGAVGIVASPKNTKNTVGSSVDRRKSGSPMKRRRTEDALDESLSKV